MKTAKELRKIYDTLGHEKEDKIIEDILLNCEKEAYIKNLSYSTDALELTPLEFSYILHKLAELGYYHKSIISGNWYYIDVSWWDE